MTYPKMIYKSDVKYADDEGLRLAFLGFQIQSQIVQSEEEEQAAFDVGWTDSPADFIGIDKPKRKRKADAADSSEVPQEVSE